MNNLSLLDFAALSPLLIVLGGALFLLIGETFFETAMRKWGNSFTLAVLALAFGATLTSPGSSNPLLTAWITFDSLARILTLLFVAVAIGTTLLSDHNAEGEYYFLLLSALFGLLLIGVSADFLTLFIGLETLSISLYILVGYVKKWTPSHEASVKYFLIGAMGAAFLLYGIALLYGAVGFTHFNGLLEAYQKLSTPATTTLFISGITFVTVGLSFKAALVPFHTWAPDVYEGASTPVTFFMAVGTKIGAFAAFARVFLVALPQFDLIWNEAISILAYLTLIYANYVAMRQIQLRRFFAYSGISHAGFLLIPFVAGTQDALSALVFYLSVYALASLGCFAVLVILEQQNEGVSLSDLRGLFTRSPLLAGVFSLSLLTLAGIPPTVGFFAKFYLFKIAFDAGYYSLVVVALLTTILSAYYYLRIVAVMLAPVKGKEAPPSKIWPAALVGTLSCAALIALSFYPAPLSTLLKK